jgi:hypothetical protein
MNNPRRINPINQHTMFHQQSSSAPGRNLEFTVVECDNPHAQLRRDREQAKASYEDLFKDYQHALRLYNETNLENMILRDRIAMLERVLLSRSAGDFGGHLARY